MVFFEILSHAIALDFGFFIEFIIGNIFWLFSLYAVIHFFVEGKKVIWSFIVLVLNLWILTDWSALGGGVFVVGGFLLINYIVKLSVLSLAENHRFLKSKMIWVNEFFAWSVIILFNIAVLIGLWVL